MASVPLARNGSIAGARPDRKRSLAAGAATAATQSAFQIEEPREGGPTAHQQLMGDSRLVPASAAGGLDQVPEAQVLQPEIVARRLAHHFLPDARSLYVLILPAWRVVVKPAALRLAGSSPGGDC